MRKKFLSYLLVMVLSLFAVPSAFAASITWQGVKTDTMTAWDTRMPSLSSQWVPMSGTQWYPHYNKPNSNIQFKVQSSGISYPYFFREGGQPVNYKIISTTYNSNGRLDVVQVALNDLSLDSSNYQYVYTNPLTVTSTVSSGSTQVSSISLTPSWWYN